MSFCSGISKEQALSMADRMGIPESAQENAADYFIRLYNLFIGSDATLIEINPLAEDSEGHGELSNRCCV